VVLTVVWDAGCGYADGCGLMRLGGTCVVRGRIVSGGVGGMRMWGYGRGRVEESVACAAVVSGIGRSGVCVAVRGGTGGGER
jgi:hypothetical protein